MYPKFVEIHGDDDTFTLNVDAIQCFSGNCVIMRSAEVYETKESYEELKALIQDAGYLIHKADPRLDVTHPLTMADLKEMIGEPVWNSNLLKWMIVQAFVDSDHPAIWLVKPDSQLLAMTAEELVKFPLYRMKLQ